MTTSNFTTTATRIATLLAIFGFMAFASQTAWAQKGNGAGKSGNHHQAAAKSKQKSNTPKVNRNDKTYGIGKSISAGPGPLPTVNQDNKYRRRGTLVQNGANPFAHGGAGNVAGAAGGSHLFPAAPINGNPTASEVPFGPKARSIRGTFGLGTYDITLKSQFAPGGTPAAASDPNIIGRPRNLWRLPDVMGPGRGVSPDGNWGDK